jgi:hypothetical protein
MNRPPLADRQERAAAVLEALPPALAREARQLLAELAMISCGPITSYQPASTSGAGGSRDPSTGDQWPAHHELLHRLAEAVSATDVRDALNWARHELAALRRAPQNAKVTGESEAERAKRIVKEGEGWGMHDVANTLNDLRDLNRAGFPDLAKTLAAGACADCGHSRASRFHREACEERLNPVRAPEQPRQPWEPRPARQAA